MANTSESEPTLFPILPSNGEPPVWKGIARLAAAAPVIDEGHCVEFHGLPIRSILNHVNSRRGFGFARSINPYRGCEFACKYCYARYTHEFMELRDPYSFERQIYIKENAAWLLRQELRSLKPQESIAIGTATDPYQPIERNARVTRALLEVFAEQRGLRLGLVTKSTLVTRDIDLLQRIALQNRISISLTITTLDARLARILEPRAPRPDLRIETLRRLRKAGLRAGVLCCPLIPGITDNFAAIDSVATEAKRVGACSFHANPLFLKPCSKPVFEDFIAKNFPELLASYQERFKDHAFARPAYRKYIQQIVHTVQVKHGWKHNFEDTPARLEPSLPNSQMQMPYPGSIPVQAQRVALKETRSFISRSS